MITITTFLGYSIEKQKNSLHHHHLQMSPPPLMIELSGLSKVVGLYGFEVFDPDGWINLALRP